MVLISEVRLKPDDTYLDFLISNYSRIPFMNPAFFCSNFGYDFSNQTFS